MYVDVYVCKMYMCICLCVCEFLYVCMFNLFVVSAMFIVYLEWNNTLFRALIVKPIAQCQHSLRLVSSFFLLTVGVVSQSQLSESAEGL